MSGFREEDRDLRGPIEVAPRLPVIHRKIAGEVVTERVLPPSMREPSTYREDVDVELLRHDRPSGFARWASAQGVSPVDDHHRYDGDRASGLAIHMATSGAGSDPNYDSYERRSPGGRRPGGYDGAGGEELSTTYDTDEDVGESDLFGQPSHAEERRPREEYRDRIPEDRRVTDPGYLDHEDRFRDTRSSPTVDLGGGRSPVRDPRRDSTFAKYNLK